ncbi:hypothetical protein V8C42DRAFT_336824 [Trichoderma barbatum]
MAIKTYPALSETLNTLKETIHSLQTYPEHDSISFLNLVLRILLQAVANFGKTLPRELRWCENLPTIEALEESTPTKNQSSIEPTAQDDTCCATEDIPRAGSSSPEDTAQDDASATQDTSNAERCPTPEDIAQDDTCCATEDIPRAGSSSPDDTAQDDTCCATEDIPRAGSSSPEDIAQDDTCCATEDIPRAGSSSPDDTAQEEDAMVQELMAQASKFEKWTKDPSEFWKDAESAQTLQLPSSTPNERIHKFIIQAAEAESNDMARNSGRKFDSVIVYRRFRNLYPDLVYHTSEKIQEFGKSLGYSPVQSQEKLDTLLSRGRRRTEFCHLLSEDGTKPSEFWSDMDFQHSNYGALFLGVDERMWGNQSKYRALYKRTLAQLRSTKIIAALEESGAALAAESILQFRWLVIQGLLPPFNNQKSNNMVGSISSSRVAVLQSPWSIIQEPPSMFNYQEYNDTAASHQSCQSRIQSPSAPPKRSSAEAGFDDPVASKRSCAAPNLNILAQLALTGQSPTASETASVLHTMQLNDALSLTPQVVEAFLGERYYTPNLASHTQNLVDAQDGGPSSSDDINDEHLQEDEADLNLNGWSVSKFWNENLPYMQDGGPTSSDDIDEHPQEADLDLNGWRVSKFWKDFDREFGL